MMKTAFAIIAISLLVTGLLPLAAADEDSLQVVVLVEDKGYSVGTSGKVTVHVFDKGAHVDADAAPETRIGFYPTRAINVSKAATGVYEGPFTIQQGDALGSTVLISSGATLGKSNQSDTSYNEDSDTNSITMSGASSTGLSVTCYIRSAPRGALKPGAAITVESQVRYNGSLVTPSLFRLEASYDDNESETVTRQLNASATSTGTYSAVYDMPNVPYNTDVTFESYAEYQTDDDQSSMTLSVDFFNVICHRVSKSSTSATLDIFVADADGKPVKGAVVSLSYPPDDRGSDDKTVSPAPTDGGGRTRAVLPFNEGLKTLHIEGTANASGKSQSFSGSVPLVAQTASVPTPSGDGFEAVAAGDTTTYPAGSTVNRDYYLFNDSKAWAQKTVYCYIVTNSYSMSPPKMSPVSVEARTQTTDASGKLRITVRGPSGKDALFLVRFESATGTHDKPGGYFGDHDSLDGSSYSEDTDYFMTGNTAPGEVLKVSVKELKIGAPSELSASARSGDPPVALAGWGPGEWRGMEDPSISSGDWFLFNEIPTMLTRSGSKYTGTVTIPSFMPKDGKYTVIVMLQSSEMSFGYGLTTLSPGEGTDTGAFPWLYVIIAIVAIIVIIVVVVLLLKRRPAPVPPSEVVNFAGSPPVSQPPAVPPGGMAPAGETAGPPGPGAPPVPPPPPQYQQQPPQQYPPAPPQQYQQPAQQQLPPPPPQQYQQPAYVAAPPPTGPLPPPSRQGKMAMPNNAMCAFCNQWLLQGTTGIMCHCGKCYHEHCAKIQDKCGNCGTKLAY